MKIGILTYHAACNFGANLQVLSTVEYFRRKGYDVEVINWFTDELENVYSKATSEAQRLCHEKFRWQYLPMSTRCRDEEDIASVIEKDKIEAIVIGSDAVAQHHPVLSRIIFPSRHIVSVKHITADRLFPNPYWGSFQPLLKTRIPMAMMSVSCQNSPYHFISRKERMRMRHSVDQFAYISTRDDWTSKMFEYITEGSITPPVSPDPVFAFNYNVRFVPSEEEIREKFNLEGKYILLSFHNSHTVSLRWLDEFEIKVKSAGFECVALPFPQGIEFDNHLSHHVPLPLSPLDWYALIKYSSAYVGDNMHPIVVCLHNAVPCFSFDHYGIKGKENSSKVYHIMKKYGLLDNRVSLVDNYKMPDVDFVLLKLRSFNQSSVKNTSQVQLYSYLNMMAEE